MREEYGKHKIAIYGSKNEINLARHMLDNLTLNGDEPRYRLIIQHNIDLLNIKADILYDGNGVWSYNKVIRDFNKLLKSKPDRLKYHGEYQLTKYLYKFFTLCGGSIAHYNLAGWTYEYQSKQEVKDFIKCNEFRQDILRHQPSWKTDCIRIAKELLCC